MAPTKNSRPKTMSHEDDLVFKLLAEAREQYERYIEVTERLSASGLPETPVVPPSPDLPLSLTLWNDE